MQISLSPSLSLSIYMYIYVNINPYIMHIFTSAASTNKNHPNHKTVIPSLKNTRIGVATISMLLKILGLFCRI